MNKPFNKFTRMFLLPGVLFSLIISLFWPQIIAVARPAPIIMEVQVSTPSIFHITDAMLLQWMLDSYPRIAHETASNYIKWINEYSKEYGVDPLLVFGVLSIESSFQPRVSGAAINVRDFNKKKVVTKAIGMGQVVWEIWKPKLLEIGLKEKRDLYNPRLAIKSSAYILSVYGKQRLLKGTKTATESSLRRYWGGKDKKYQKRIEELLGRFSLYHLKVQPT